MTCVRSLTRRERLLLALQRTTDKGLTRPFRWVYRRTHGRIADLYKVDALLLTTTGRRTGRPRTVVLQYFPDGQDMVVAAANDGGRTDPDWYRNLLADPHAVVEVGATRSDVTAEVLALEEASDWWARILEVAPTYERYQRATSRQIPIVRLRAIRR